MAGTVEDLPLLGGRIKEIVREARRSKPQLDLHEKVKGKATSRLSGLAKAEKSISKGLRGKSGAVARVLGSRLGARLLPALAIAMTARDVGRATQEGVKAYTAMKDLERTREHVRKKYGTPKRAAETRASMRR